MKSPPQHRSRLMPIAVKATGDLLVKVGTQHRAGASDLYRNAQVLRPSSPVNLLTNVDLQLPSRAERLKWLLDWFCERYGAGVGWDLAARLRSTPIDIPTEEQDGLAADVIREYVAAAEQATPGAHAAFWEAFDCVQPDKDW